jgi:hypothetical protein
MFNFGKKKEDETPQEALDHAKKTMNSGLTGGLTKAFMGKGFVDKMNNAMDKGQEAINMQNSGQWLLQSGLEGSAQVISIEDTGKLINFNPVVKLSLKVTPSMMGMPAFDTVGETVVSKIAIPRKGETVKIKYSPMDPSQFVVVP